MWANKSIQRMGASSSDHSQLLCKRRLAPDADAQRSAALCATLYLSPC